MASRDLNASRGPYLAQLEQSLHLEMKKRTTQNHSEALLDVR